MPDQTLATRSPHSFRSIRVLLFVTATATAFASSSSSRADDTASLLDILAHWGACAQPCPIDLNGDGVVDHIDLVLTMSTPTPRSRPPQVIPDGYMIIEGDIIVPTDFYAADTTFNTNLWPNGVVPFAFDAGISQADRDQATLAMSLWEAVANIDFRPANFDLNWIQFHDADGNSSPVGRQLIGGQPLNMLNWENEFIIAHELGHALGFWHEQSRADRGNFVTIDLDNVCQDCCSGGSCDHNFDIRPSGDEYGPYDFDSVMHYDQCAFSDCASCNNLTSSCWTIDVLPPNEVWQNAMGQRDHLSAMDQMTMSFLYPETNWRFVNALSTNFLEFGTFIDPWKTFQQGADLTPTGGTLWISEPASYDETGTFSRAMTIRAPLGGVTIGQ